MGGLQKITNQKEAVGKPVNNMIKLKNLIKEVSSDHSNDRDMVTGVAEIIKMVKDLDNRKDIASTMIAKFRNEDVIFDKDEFLKMCKCK
jgi:hypothetical protein